MRLLALLLAALLGLSACGAPCTQDADCALPAVCSAAGRCEVPAPAADGAACSDDAHCLGGACLVSSEGGRCATACDDAEACASGRCALATDARAAGSRLRFVCTPASGDRYYAEPCGADDACTSGVCHEGRCTAPCGTCPVGSPASPRR